MTFDETSFGKHVANKMRINQYFTLETGISNANSVYLCISAHVPITEKKNMFKKN